MCTLGSLVAGTIKREQLAYRYNSCLKTNFKFKKKPATCNKIKKTCIHLTIYYTSASIGY